MSNANIRRAAPLVALLALSCGEGSGPTEPERALAAVWAVSGDGQSDTVGHTLERPVVLRALDADNRPLPGQRLTFAVTVGAGRVCAVAGDAAPAACPATAVTDAQGEARATWTLGTLLTPSHYNIQKFEVRAADPATGAERVYAVVQAGATADVPAAIEPWRSAEGPGVAGAVLGTLQVLVTDRHGNLVPNAAVAWATTAGGGTLTNVRPTDEDGVARAVWTLGTEPVPIQTVTATVPGVPPVRFDARAASSVRVMAGDGTSAPPGTVVDASVQLLAVDGLPVGGVTVAWSAPDGSVSGGASRTDAQGYASARWTLGGAPGLQTLTASAGPLRATLSATVVPGDVVGRTLVTQVPGRVLDADATRVLWLDSTSAAPSNRLALRDPASGADATIAVVQSAVRGALFPGGVLFWTGTGLGDVLEWRAGTGTVATVGAWGCDPKTFCSGEIAAPVVEGTWAAWWGRNADGNVRRDLAAGTNVSLGGDDGAFFSVAPNGDVAWMGSSSIKLWVYRNGTATGRWPNGSTLGSHIETDGVNLAFISFADRYAYWARVMLERPDGDLELGRLGGASPSFALAGGWVAFATTQAYRRSPTGEVAALGFNDAKPVVLAIAADGSTLLKANVGSAPHYFRVSPTLAVDDLGPAFAGERVVERGGRFFVIAAGAVYELRR